MNKTKIKKHSNILTNGIIQSINANAMDKKIRKTINAVEK